MTRGFALAAVIALTASASAQDYKRAGKPVATVYTPSEHGGHNQNWSWFEADDGLVYVSHTTGISQWDGETWQSIATPGDTPVRQACQWAGDGRVYAGTTNDFGALDIGERNELGFRSLLTDWSFDARQFGEVWSIACVDAGVVFATTESVYLWDGQDVRTIEDMPTGRYRLFTVDDAILSHRDGRSGRPGFSPAVD